MTFRGWPAEALDFYEGLEADNSKTYWSAHKDFYEAQVRAPMTELLAALAPEFGPAKIFRPYRDVRFSADKSPYKTHCAASFERGGYVQLGAEGLAAGSGAYLLDREQLARFRAAVLNDLTGEEIAAIVAGLTARGWEVIAHEELKTAPRGIPADHPRIDLLRRKGLVAWLRFPVRPWLGTAQARTKVAEFLRVCEPLNDWLTRNVTHTGVA